MTDAATPRRDRPDRILMLVPHEPKLDPRVGWVIDLCKELGRTEVIAATWSADEPSKEYDGKVSIERVNVMQTASPNVIRALPFANRIGAHKSAQEFAERQGSLPPRMRGLVRHHIGAARRLVAAWTSYALLVSALYRRAKVVGVKPKVVIAHDIYALIPAVLLKRRWGAAVIYDSHEYTPHGDLLAPRWQQVLTRAVERRFIRRADRVITVSPPLAGQLERDYGLSRTISVPNAEPARGSISAISPPPDDGVVQFVLQGQAAPGRGFERFFELWETLAEPMARLLVRCPDGPYPEELRVRFADLFASDRAEWLDAVPESEMVAAASSAQVGVIPYLGPNLNHVYACPNKLSQYMAAGLAILSTDLEYIAAVLAKYRCGVVYDPCDESSFAEAISQLVTSPESLTSMREHALSAAQSDYNWEGVSGAYSEAVHELLRRPQ